MRKLRIVGRGSFLRLVGRRPQPEAAQDPVEELLASGLFDPEWWAATSGCTFADVETAARHYVDGGLARGVMPHPLLDPGALPADVLAAVRRQELPALLRYLRGEDGCRSRLGPLFDSALAPGSDEEKRAHPGGALGLFLHGAQDHTGLPVPPNHPERAVGLGVARAVLTERSAEIEAQRRAVASARHRTSLRRSELWWTRRAASGSGHSPTISVLVESPPDAATAQSLLAMVERQTHDRWELVVPAPTDPAGAVAVEPMRARSAVDPRVRLVEVSTSSGPLTGALPHATGELVAFAESDLDWEPQFLQHMAAVLTEDGAPAAFGAAGTPGRDGSAVYRWPDPRVEPLRMGPPVPRSTLVCRRDELVGLDLDDPSMPLVLATRSTPAAYPFLAGTATRENPRLHRAHRDTIGRSLVDWEAARNTSRRADLVSVVVATHQDTRLTATAVRSVLRHAGSTHERVEVVVVDNASRRDVGMRLAAFFAGDDRVRHLRLPRRLSLAAAANAGFAASRGSRVVFLHHDTEVRHEWLDTMLPSLSDDAVRGVQALLLRGDDTIQSAGVAFDVEDAEPRHLLAGHPPEDAERTTPRRLAAVTAAALLVRADEFAALDGFDPALGDRWADVDYCLRAVQRAGGGFVVAPRAWVTHHGRTTGDALADDEGHDQQVFWSRWRGRLPAAEDDSPPDLDHDPLPPPSRAAAGPALRWGLRIASTPGSWGDTWGDTFFARALADALRALGQDVVTHRHGAHDTAVGDLDDVVLVIRGLVPVLPRPGKLNLLWVISHPDEVTDAELQGFDLVLAASEGWAEAARRRTHRPVRTLHQALDLDTLPDSDVPLGPGTVPVFVGSNNPPFRERTAVERAAEAGIGLALHGHGWSGTKAESCVVTDHVPPYDVPTLYRRHGLVLADHWPDMATNGFVANRVFEAVAAGARVVSDPVTGIEDLFGGAVQVYHSVDELRLLCSPAGRDRWPSDAEMGEIAARTREEHSFRRRAEILLEAAVSLRDAR